jgi:hypothetical protein
MAPLQPVVVDPVWMTLRCHSLRLVALAVVVSLPLLGVSGVASAKAKAGCHKTHTCKTGGGSGTGGATPSPITVQIDPNPVVETSSSAIAVVIQVETSPTFAGDTVDITSSQLQATCTEFIGFVQPESVETSSGGGVPLVVPVTLDDDGNATVAFFGQNCAPGSSLVEASLAVAPYYTALGTLIASPPVVTPPGVFGYPTTSGTVAGGEVETGDTGSAADQSDVYAVFNVETDPVYGDQPVEINWDQLQMRCLAAEGFVILPSGGALIDLQEPGGVATTIPPVPLDNDGNAVFVFIGGSCAAGSSVVTADVLAGTHPTYTTTFSVLPPQPTT